MCRARRLAWRRKIIRRCDPNRALCLRTLRVPLAIILLIGSWRGGVVEAKAAPPVAASDLTQLPAFHVTGERLEDFGFRVSHDFDLERARGSRRVFTPVVDGVLPNTAASKAGMRPGDRILTSDGVVTASETSSLGRWRGMQKKKWTEVASGKSGVTWTLEVETAGTLEMRTLKLQLPTPAPHWGSTAWRAPEDRISAVVPEPGPLAERAQGVLSHGIWTLLRGSYVKGLRLPVDAMHPYFLCYQWTLWSGSTGHRIYVSRQRGRTDIIFEVILKEDTSFFRAACTHRRSRAKPRFGDNGVRHRRTCLSHLSLGETGNRVEASAQQSPARNSPRGRPGWIPGGGGFLADEGWPRFASLAVGSDR